MDGGYYAIKGFEFQFDKTLIEALDSTDENAVLSLEQIQDINNSDFVMQIKYKEATKFTPSVIRNPIIQLIEEYQKDKSKRYILYCHFSDKNKYSEKIDLKHLNTILGKEQGRFTNNDKNDFLSAFELRFSETFQAQFETSLNKLQLLSFVNSKDDAIYFYSILIDYLRKKVVKNAPQNLIGRQVTKKELIDYLNKGRKIIFLNSYKEYRGEQEYFRFLKSRFKKPVKNQNTIVYLGKIEETDICNLPSFIFQLIEKHYHKANHDIKPLTFVIPFSKVENVKKYLIQQNCPYNDGYETILFNQKHFESSAIINKKILGKKTTNSLSKTSFKARIISNETFDNLSKLGIPVSWIFIESKVHHLLCDSNYQVISRLNTEQILKLF
ncbi:hypothetical protein GCM10027429_02960 [Marivirga atlantica]|uniref:Uncharacterized protein n=1 Tax=Marivirga atlantica TaxID=1548457 RepID=A0A937DFP6_9BACT|nr:hypothetical protein [Marivirga atlantica]MBL0763908.1 hypothetical protein [Marivirga atlantica]